MLKTLSVKQRFTSLIKTILEHQFISKTINFYIINMETTKKVKWVLDPSHSEILFKVKHLMISNVKGEFRKFTAEIKLMGI